MKRAHLDTEGSLVVNVSIVDGNSPDATGPFVDVDDDTFVGPGYTYTAAAGFIAPEPT